MQTSISITFEEYKARAEKLLTEVQAYYEEHDLYDYLKHHVGHAFGILYHDAPFFDLGGYRHSDMVLITEDGIEILTYYPRNLESLIIPA